MTKKRTALAAICCIATVIVIAIIVNWKNINQTVTWGDQSKMEPVKEFAQQYLNENFDEKMVVFEAYKFISENCYTVKASPENGAFYFDIYVSLDLTSIVSSSYYTAFYEYQLGKELSEFIKNEVCEESKVVVVLGNKQVENKFPVLAEDIDLAEAKILLSDLYRITVYIDKFTDNLEYEEEAADVIKIIEHMKELRLTPNALWISYSNDPPGEYKELMGLDLRPTVYGGELDIHIIAEDLESDYMEHKERGW